MPANSPQACMADFTAALVGRDIGSALSLLADDVVIFVSNGTTIRGKEAFASVMAANWQLVEDCRYQTLEPAWIAEGGAVASVIYGFEWSGVVRGEKVGGGGRATRVFCKSDAGWLLAHEHLSAGQSKA
jgi:ketosteroid isomerase-like protein